MTRADINLIHGDCMTAMKAMRDNEYSLAICDPPYGIGASRFWRGGTQHGKSISASKNYGIKEWDSQSPSTEYYEQVLRVSKNQIMWGANHYISKLPLDSPCWIVWDKQTGSNGYADCELAWTSFKGAVRMFVFMWKGMFQGHMGTGKETRIHPTQKPVALYRWILKNYAKEGDTILDTHGGSCSLAIACWDMKHDATIYEIDIDYYEAAVKRFNRHKSQGQLF